MTFPESFIRTCALALAVMLNGCAALSSTPTRLTVFDETEAEDAARASVLLMTRAGQWQPGAGEDLSASDFDMGTETYSESCMARGQRETWWDTGETYANDHGQPFPASGTRIERSADDCLWFVSHYEHGWMQVEIDNGVVDPDTLSPRKPDDIELSDMALTYTYDEYWQSSPDGSRGCLDGSLRIEAEDDDAPLTARSEQLALCHQPSVWFRDVEIELNEQRRVGRWEYINGEQFRRMEVEIQGKPEKRGVQVTVTGAEDVSMEMTLNSGRITASRWVEPAETESRKGAGKEGE